MRTSLLNSSNNTKLIKWINYLWRAEAKAVMEALEKLLDKN